MNRLFEHLSLSNWKGKVASPSEVGYARQPLCGDEVWLDLKIAGGVLSQVRFRGQGCVVSMACASMLCEGVEGRAVADVLATSPEILMDFEIGQFSEWKRRCALLGWEALRAAILSDPVASSDSMRTTKSTGDNDLIGPSSEEPLP